MLPGFQLVALDADAVGSNGVIDLWVGLLEGTGRQEEPGQIGASSSAIVVGDVVVVGAAMLAGGASRSKAVHVGPVRHTELFAHRDRHASPLTHMFVGGHVLAADEVLTEVGMQRLQHRCEVDRIGRIEFGVVPRGCATCLPGAATPARRAPCP